jgi:hypothetical protein
VIGIGAATAIARLNAPLFLGALVDVPAFLASAALLAVIALGASYAPAKRIADEDAVLALRAE